MSESVPHAAEARRQIIIRNAQRTTEVLSRNRTVQDKSCAEAFEYLRQLREEIQRDPLCKIENPDPQFALYYKELNDTEAHYEALFTLLKDAGYSRSDVEIAFMDMLAAVKFKDSGEEGSAAKRVLALSEAAMDRVFQK